MDTEDYIMRIGSSVDNNDNDIIAAFFLHKKSKEEMRGREVCYERTVSSCYVSTFAMMCFSAQI